jgi:fucose permease
MPSSDTLKAPASARTLTLAAYVSFVPIGVATVLLGPMLPILSARWSLNYSQAGRLFPVQYVSSTVAVALSGWLVSRWGFRFAIKAGLLLMTAGLVLMMAGPKLLALICIAAYGAGLGLSVPAANLMVAELNPDRRSATLNWLNFCWSAGAVSCPFLVAVAAKNHHVPLLLASVSACSLLLAMGFALLPGHLAESARSANAGPKIIPVIQRSLHPFLLLAALFFVYVGTENSFGGWVASYAKSLGNLNPAMALMTPSFFYAALTFGRWLAPFLLHIDEIKLVRAGLLLGCAGSAGLIFSHGLAGVVTSACAAGLGLSYVYPITISLLSREFGAASSKIGSVMFVLSNVGGGLFPWIVGISSNRFGTLKAGLFVPLLGCAAMFALYLGNYWDRSRMAD